MLKSLSLRIAIDLETMAQYSMREQERPLSAKELKKQAYLAAMRLKNAGLDDETIYARLEKQGYSTKLAEQAAKDVTLEHARHAARQAKPAADLMYKSALIKIGVSIVAAIIFNIAFPGHYAATTGILSAGIAAALLRRKINNG